MKYRTKPAEVDAFRLPSQDEDAEPFIAWADEVDFNNWFSGRDGTLEITSTDEESRVIYIANPGDWIVKREDKDFIAVPDEQFKSLYVLVWR